MVEILYKSKNAVVINKPCGMPSQSDPTGSTDAMTATQQMLGKAGEDNRLWLVHRLDRVVSGAIVYARNKRTAGEISALIRDGLIAKEYLAVVDGAPADDVLSDFIYRDARVGKAFIVDRELRGVKSCKLSYRTLETVSYNGEEKSLLYVTLYTGRFHQIRAQLSSRGMPIVGDGKYGSRDKRAHRVALHSTHVSLNLGREMIDVTALPDIEEYPWSLFDFSKLGE